ncbi:MAG TPA: hypothetical protein VK186_02575 [Candidatus Deferrimicrobium sp.]|nr:hypothetical protein [Candidatus Kapabacteria bacterium]HLP57680.1 hypothetical protein [Candidatus Deferrimicrobium sp.]
MLNGFISLLHEWLEAREKRNRDYYYDFIKDFRASFEVLHSNYVTSFEKYRNRFLEIEFPVDRDSDIVKEIVN